MEILKYILYSFLFLIGAYILIRILTRAAFKSYWEVKKEEQNEDKEKVK